MSAAASGGPSGPSRTVHHRRPVEDLGPSIRVGRRSLPFRVPWRRARAVVEWMATPVLTAALVVVSRLVGLT